MFTLQSIVAVGCGGFVGAIARFVIAGWTQHLWRWGWFPIGTVTVNVIGCFALGALAGWNEQVRIFPPVIRAFLLVGVIGSFTTFSTFSYENVVLLREGRVLLAGTNAVGQVVIGGLVAFLGYSSILKIAA